MKKQQLPNVAGIKDQAGNIVDPALAIIPLCTTNSQGQIALIGTGYYIGQYGLLLTAKHVVTDERLTEPSKLFAIQILPGNIFRYRHAVEWAVHPVNDIAVILLMGLQYKNVEVKNKVLTMTRRIPEVGEIASTCAYPKSTFSSLGSLQIVELNTTWHFGFIEEHHPDGRDRVFLPGHCFRTSVPIHSGASGGPILDKEGKAFGVNSTGVELSGNDEPISYITPISGIEELYLNKLSIDGVKMGTSVSELIQQKYIRIQ